MGGGARVGRARSLNWPCRDSGRSSHWQAFKLLYETTQHHGIVAGLAIFKRRRDCLGTTWTSNTQAARDLAFFRTVDMADTGYCGFFPAAVALSHTLALGNRHVPEGVV